MVSKELKQKNEELRQLVEREKRKLQDKVHEELEKTLAQALKEKIYAEEKLRENEQLMQEHYFVFEEVDSYALSLREQLRDNSKLTSD